jgi:hypothetical protein
MQKQARLTRLTVSRIKRTSGGDKIDWLMSAWQCSWLGLACHASVTVARSHVQSQPSNKNSLPCPSVPTLRLLWPVGLYRSVVWKYWVRRVMCMN